MHQTLIHVLAVIGARPQIIKLEALKNAWQRKEHARIAFETAYTGQHYDDSLKGILTKTGKSSYDYELNMDGTSHAEQTAKMMLELEDLMTKKNCNGVLVFGDTNTTLAAALVASKMHIPLAHIEAGMRSGERSMPEEINRSIIDHVSDLNFCVSRTAKDFLDARRTLSKQFLIGDLMKDLFTQQQFDRSTRPLEHPYYYATVHRAANTDDAELLNKLLFALYSLDCEVVVSTHPRLRKALDGVTNTFENIQFIEPQSYADNLVWMYHSKAVLTDSGGMQKEAYWMQKRCVTLRSNTEWVETLTGGNNTLWSPNMKINLYDVLHQPMKDFDKALYGDGQAAQQILTTIHREWGS